MTKKLTLNLSFNQVFDDYSEVFVGNSLRFEGCLRPCFEGVSNFNLIRFVSGGRRYVTYRLDRDGDFVRGSITYRPYDPESVSENQGIRMDDETNKRFRLDDETIKRIRKLRKENLSQVEIAKKVGSSQTTVSNVLKKKGAYAE